MSCYQHLPHLLLSASLLLPAIVAAECRHVDSTSVLSQAAIDAGYTASSWSINLGNSRGILGLPGLVTLGGSANFQPEGTLLASASASFLSAARVGGYPANQVLFRCDVTELGQIYEYYATSAAETHGGMFVVPGLEEAYYTAVQNVAVRLTNQKTGEYYSRYWKRRPIPESDVFNDGTYIYIPASAFSDVFVELLRADDRSKGKYIDSGYLDRPVVGEAANGHIAFQGGSLSPDLSPGADCINHNLGYGVHWPGAWSIAGQGTKYVRGAACHISDYPSLVQFPPATVADLRDGHTSQAPFSINVECESGAVSGTQASTETSSRVAMGFLVNNATAASQARALGLTTPSGAYTWLLDNHYGASGVASGVGIRIYSDKLSGQPLNLLPGSAIKGTGNDGGWYGYQALTELITSDITEIHAGAFTASLEAIPGETITQGTVNAQLQVMVSFQ
ncbi:TPA: fimbrial usher protein StbD [Klebsiella oxytoca]|nr:fimbrial usher protein StbD [Klebsiella oxytoca]